MNTSQQHAIDAGARELRDLLAQCGWRLVLAESCTAGRVSAALSSLPGISQWLCGCLVVYRCDSKTRWLGVPADLLADPGVGPVCRDASRLLAIRSLTITPEANLAVAVTGDVGPGAPPKTDGRLFCACQVRHSGLIERDFELSSPAPSDSQDIAARTLRLEEATARVLRFAIECIQSLQSIQTAGDR